MIISWMDASCVQDVHRQMQEAPLHKKRGHPVLHQMFS